MQAQSAVLDHLVDTHLAACAEPDAARRLGAQPPALA